MPDTTYVCFMASNRNNVLYIGVTSNLERRVWEHKNHNDIGSFTAKYHCHKLMYFEVVGDIRYAIEREKQLKNWKREWKNQLVERENPAWEDLSIGWNATSEIADKARNDGTSGTGEIVGN